MHSDHPRDEHHHIEEGQRWSEEGEGGEHFHDTHVALPAAVNLLVVHIGFHLVLLLAELIDGLKEVVGKPQLICLYDLPIVLADLEGDKRLKGSYDSEHQVYEYEGEEL